MEDVNVLLGLIISLGTITGFLLVVIKYYFKEIKENLKDKELSYAKNEIMMYIVLIETKGIMEDKDLRILGDLFDNYKNLGGNSYVEELYEVTIDKYSKLN